jgi:hypothetical protein
MAAWVQYNTAVGPLGTNEVLGIAAEQPGPDQCAETLACVEMPGTPDEVRAAFPLPEGCTTSQVELEIYRVATTDPVAVEIFPDLVDSGDNDQVTLFDCQVVTSLGQLSALVGVAVAAIDTAYVPGAIQMPNVVAGVTAVCAGVTAPESDCPEIRNNQRILMKRARRADNQGQAEDEAQLLDAQAHIWQVFQRANQARLAAGF